MYDFTACQTFFLLSAFASPIAPQSSRFVAFGRSVTFRLSLVLEPKDKRRSDFLHHQEVEAFVVSGSD